MVTYKNFSIDFVQAVLFLPPDTTFASSKTVAIVLQNFGNMFDGEMQVLPIPAAAPAEVPRVLLQSADGTARLHAGPSRVEVVISGGDSVHDSAARCRDVVSVYGEKIGFTPVRVAFIVNRYFQCSSPAQELIDRFCNDNARNGAFARSMTFEIHNHKEYTPQWLRYPVNSWVRCSCGRREPTAEPVLHVSQDINSLVSDHRGFSPSRIGEFFDAAPLAAEEILNRYFPD